MPRSLQDLVLAEAKNIYTTSLDVLGSGTYLYPIKVNTLSRLQLIFCFSDDYARV